MKFCHCPGIQYFQSLFILPRKKTIKIGISQQRKKILDKLHKDKILSSDAIVVINHCAYIGQSTLSEINFAKACKKKIYFIESWGKGCGIDGSCFAYSQDYMHALNIYGVYSPISTVDRVSPLYNDVYKLYDLFPNEYRIKYLNRLKQTELNMYKAAGVDVSGITLQDLI